MQAFFSLFYEPKKITTYVCYRNRRGTGPRGPALQTEDFFVLQEQ
jgi:hypothetical protein